jgi:ferredoxin
MEYRRRLHRHRRLRKCQKILDGNCVHQGQHVILSLDHNILETKVHDSPPKDVHSKKKDVHFLCDVHVPKVNREKCVGCGTCRDICPGKAIHIENGIAVIDKDKCKKCRKCVKVCPINAIE